MTWQPLRGQLPAIASAVSSARVARRITRLRHEAMTADQGGPRGARARSDGAEGTRRDLQMTLPAAGHAVALARQATRDALATWRLARLEETAVLLVSELV